MNTIKRTLQQLLPYIKKKKLLKNTFITTSFVVLEKTPCQAPCLTKSVTNGLERWFCPLWCVAFTGKNIIGSSIPPSSQESQNARCQVPARLNVIIPRTECLPGVLLDSSRFRKTQRYASPGSVQNHNFNILNRYKGQVVHCIIYALQGGAGQRRTPLTLGRDP